MTQQYNKGIKRKRRERYLKRLKQRSAKPAQKPAAKETSQASKS